MTRPNAELIAIIFARFGMRGDILLQRLQQIKESAFQDRSSLSAKNPSWDTRRDARLRSLQKLINIIDRTQFQVHIIGKLLA